MLLAIDIGNSNIVLGIYQNNEWFEMFRMPTHSKDFLLMHTFLEKYSTQIKKSVFSSVVPSVNSDVISVLADYQINLLMIDKSIFPKLNIEINNPDEIGTDLVANAVYAHHYYPKDHKVIIDFGTALTFTTLNNQGQIIGVAIGPGLKTAMYALFANAEQLPEVPLEMPKSVLGFDTISALQAGVLIGYVGLVEGMIKRIKEEVGAETKVLVTGGLSFLMKEINDQFDKVDKNLTIEGLRLCAINL